MTNFTILIYEDEVTYKDSLEYSLKEKIKVKGKRLIIYHKENGDTLQQDLMICSPNLIMVDHDLGLTTGDEIIELIDQMPEYKNVSIYYYSGGESLEDLEMRARRHACNIRCFTKEGNDLDTAILGLI